MLENKNNFEIIHSFFSFLGRELSDRPRTLTIQRIPYPQKSHRQISTADLPANTQSNFIITFNTQYIKYRI